MARSSLVMGPVSIGLHAVTGPKGGGDGNH
jgi:hypothetical protein